jgi:hypothetical protein
MKLKEIRAMARKRLGEATGAFWSDTELNSWINSAGRDVAFKAKCIRVNVYFDSVQNQNEYSLSGIAPNIYSVLDVYFKVGGTTWKRLKPLANREDLDMQYKGWMNATASAPYAYFWDREEDLLIIHPKADALSTGTGYGRIFYARTFTDLANDDATPSIPEPLQLAMVDWVASLGYETRGYGDKANDAMQKYTAKIADYEKERNREKEDDEIISRSYRSGFGRSY